MLNVLPQFGEFKIYAFEPNEFWFQRLRKYNVELFKLAISDKNEKAKLYFCPNLVGHSLYSSKQNVTNQYEEVDCVTFSSFVRNIPNFENALNIVKINIEGAEILFFRDIIQNDIRRHIHLFLGTGHDIEKVGELQSQVSEYYSMLENNNIVIHRYSDWKPERNVDIASLISRYISLAQGNVVI